MSLLFQIPVVLAVTLACGWLSHRLGQARVVGEIIGGDSQSPACALVWIYWTSPRCGFWTAIILVAVTFGKIGGATIAARWSHQPWRYSLALGALLNTRGLVELIVLNIGYKAGIFSPALFTMMVVMALITTMGTTPMLNLLRIPNDSSPKQAT